MFFFMLRDKESATTSKTLRRRMLAKMGPETIRQLAGANADKKDSERQKGIGDKEGSGET